MRQLQILSNTFHALQNERGFAMLYLRENTMQSRQEMLGYFAKSNLSIKQLKLDIAQQKNINQTDLEQQKLIQTIDKSLKKLKTNRLALLHLKLKSGAVFDLYSYQLISPIIQLITHLILKIKNTHPSAVSAYCFFLQWKEKVGLERSIIMRGFIEGNSNKNECIEHIKVLINEQKYYKKSFLSLATIEQKSFIGAIYQTPDIDTLHTIHQQLTTQGKSDMLSEMNAKDWFALISEKINKLHSIEEKLRLTLEGDHQLSKQKINTPSTSERLAYKITLFQDMPINKVEQIISHSKIYQIPKNKTLILENNSITHLYIVLMGWVKIFKQNKILQIISNNETVLEHCLFAHQVFNANAKTITDTLMLSIPINVLNHTLEQSSKFAHNLMVMSAQKTNTALQNLQSIKHKNTEQRMGEFFLKLLNDKKWQSNTIQLPYNKSLISSYLGMSREVFSRNLKCLSLQGISVTKNTITMTNKEKLCKYCHFDTNNQCYNFQHNQCYRDEQNKN
jgi:CRP-like cAMP-binding protein